MTATIDKIRDAYTSITVAERSLKHPDDMVEAAKMRARFVEESMRRVEQIARARGLSRQELKAMRRRIYKGMPVA